MIDNSGTGQPIAARITVVWGFAAAVDGCSQATIIHFVPHETTLDQVVNKGTHLIVAKIGQAVTWLRLSCVWLPVPRMTFC